MWPVVEAELMLWQKKWENNIDLPNDILSTYKMTSEEYFPNTKKILQVDADYSFVICNYSFYFVVDTSHITRYHCNGRTVIFAITKDEDIPS